MFGLNRGVETINLHLSALNLCLGALNLSLRIVKGFLGKIRGGGQERTGHKKSLGAYARQTFNSLLNFRSAGLFGNSGRVVGYAVIGNHSSTVVGSNNFFSCGSLSRFSVSCFVTTTRCERYGYESHGHQN